MRPVKVMTCENLGGSCSSPIQGNTADEVIKAQDAHPREVVAGGDVAHEGALDTMKGRWKHPVEAMGWYREVKRDVAALPA